VAEVEFGCPRAPKSTIVVSTYVVRLFLYSTVFDYILTIFNFCFILDPFSI